MSALVSYASSDDDDDDDDDDEGQAGTAAFAAAAAAAAATAADEEEEDDEDEEEEEEVADEPPSVPVALLTAQAADDVEEEAARPSASEPPAPSVAEPALELPPPDFSGWVDPTAPPRQTAPKISTLGKTKRGGGAQIAKGFTAAVSRQEQMVRAKAAELAQDAEARERNNGLSSACTGRATRTPRFFFRSDALRTPPNARLCSQCPRRSQRRRSVLCCADRRRLRLSRRRRGGPREVSTAEDVKEGEEADG